MGCDIHAFIDYEESSGVLNAYASFVDLDRNYLLFSLLAGVRGKADPVVPPRGLPEKISWRARKEFYYWDGSKQVANEDWHTPSWLTLAELEEVERRYEELREGFWGPYLPLKAAIAAMKVLEGDRPGSTRLVFWFDN